MGVAVVVMVGAAEEEVAGATIATKIKTTVEVAPTPVPDGTSQMVKGADPTAIGVHATLTHLQNKPVIYIGNLENLHIFVLSPPPAPGRTSSPRSPDPTNEILTSSAVIIFQTRCTIHSLIQKYIHLC